MILKKETLVLWVQFKDSLYADLCRASISHYRRTRKLFGIRKAYKLFNKMLRILEKEFPEEATETKESLIP